MQQIAAAALERCDGDDGSGRRVAFGNQTPKPRDGAARGRRGPRCTGRSLVRRQSRRQKKLIGAIVRKTAPIEFHEDLSPAPPTCRDRRVGVTLVSEIADEDDHTEVDVSLFHDCNHWTWAKYRIEKHGTWVVTATVDQRTQTW